MSQVKEIIFKLDILAKDRPNLDPDIQKLIQLAKETVLKEQEQVEIKQYENSNAGYYTVKDVAELFDVSKQTVYKWVNEGKIEYEVDNSPGKQKRKGYLIPKLQFRGQYETDDSVLNKIDPTFKLRREEELKDIPDTGFNSSDMSFPQKGTSIKNPYEIKKMILAKKVE